MLYVREEQLVNDDGRITPRGAVEAFMKMWEIRRLDVLALAFVLSKPVCASLTEFTYVALEFGIKEKAVKNAFSRLMAKRFIKRCYKTVYSLSDTGQFSVKTYLPILQEINLRRDDLFKKRCIVRRHVR